MIDKLDEGERLEKGVETQDIQYSNANDKSAEIKTTTQDDVHAVLNTNYGGSMQKDNIENHIRMLEEFRAELVKLKPKFIELRDDYKKQISAMENAGFFENIITPLRNKHQTFSSKVNEIDRVIIHHQQEITRIISILNRTRARARTS